MQSGAPEAVDLSASRSDEDALRPGRPEDGRVRHPLPAGPSAGRARRAVRPALLGRRPVAMQWDAHDDIDANHEKMCGLTDKPVAALLTDLKRTGLLDDTLVVWGGEFGRTPVGRQAAGAATTTRPASPCGWPAAA